MVAWLLAFAVTLLSSLGALERLELPGQADFSTIVARVSEARNVAEFDVVDIQDELNAAAETVERFRLLVPVESVTATDEALATANDAVVEAGTALETANEALATADEAVAVADGALATADETVGAALDPAVEAVREADAVVSGALDDVSTGVPAADEALAGADEVLGTALDPAADALETADAALESVNLGGLLDSVEVPDTTVPGTDATSGTVVTESCTVVNVNGQVVQDTCAE